MDIDITDFVATEAPMDYSASVAELGHTAGEDTWRAAKERAAEGPRLLDTPDKLQALRDDARDTGAWSAEEIAAWSDDDCEALLIQMISGDMREGGISADMSDDDWAEYEAEASQGSISGRISRGDDGRIYFYLGS
jgi:hypothetical protein